MTALTTAIGELAGCASNQAITRIAQAAHIAGGPGHGFSARATRDVRAREVRERVTTVADAWGADPIPVEQFTSLLAAASSAAQTVRDDQNVRLVWTGPPTEEIPLGTADTLLSIITAAQHNLILSTFNATKEGSLVAAIEDRIAAGVEVWLIGETKTDAPHDFSGDPATRLAEIDGLRFYCWPKQKRHDWIAQISHDLHAMLHAKVAVADAHHLLLGSANLTAPAMHSNMEIGVYIEGGTLPQRVDRHMRTLVDRGVLCSMV